MADRTIRRGDGVSLQSVDRDEVMALLSLQVDGRATAPGWPHSDTRPGLSFVFDGGQQWLVLDADDRIAGECGTKRPPDRHGVVEIGYGLAPGSRGRGLGTAAVRLLVDAVLEDPAVRRIEAEVLPANHPSRRVLEKNGFVFETSQQGYLRYARDRNP